jgi:hypothetical protein
MRRISFILIVLFCLSLPATTLSQDERGDLLSRINNLRAGLGLHPYTLNSALDAAAQNQAQWMASTGNVSHYQDDGSTPRIRAVAAGYGSDWVSENIYGGGRGGVSAAWNFWVNSSIHYRGLTSANYYDIGIGISQGESRAYVLVFGNATGSWGNAGSTNTGSGSSSGGNESAAAAPSFVVGIDGRGFIMHEIQPGDTLGDIALIYGYTWDDIPYMLDVNELAQDEMRQLEIGAVFLVPPKAGTYTPTAGSVALLTTPLPPEATNPPEQPELLPPMEMTALPTTNTIPASPTFLPSATPPPTWTPMRIATAAALPDELFGIMPTNTALVVAQVPSITPMPSPTQMSPNGIQTTTSRRPAWLFVAVGLQVVVITGAGIEFVRRLLR